ncbi:hypothetical protein FBZ84_101152 [Azospirillum baldaniorum]|nr:hypothetical protein FBZ84_101152 [Azospirillum baldaniorum]
MTAQEIAEMVKIALRHADQPAVPVHRMRGPSDRQEGKAK